MNALVTLLAVMVAYLGLLSLSAWLSQPLRVRLTGIIDEMIEDGGRSHAELAELEWLAQSSASSIVGLMLPVAALSTMASVVLGAEPRPAAESERLWRDPRFEKVVSLYMWSIAACSPIAALVSAPFIGVAVALRAVQGERNLSRVAELPVLNASGLFQPG